MHPSSNTNQGNMVEIYRNFRVLHYICTPGVHLIQTQRWWWRFLSATKCMLARSKHIEFMIFYRASSNRFIKQAISIIGSIIVIIFNQYCQQTITYHSGYQHQ